MNDSPTRHRETMSPKVTRESLMRAVSWLSLVHKDGKMPRVSELTEVSRADRH